MQISKRLQAVAQMVTPGYRAADVGCDHAYTAIYLVRNKISPHVIAMDINQGPIERAEENIRKFHVADKITTRKSNGLEKLAPGEADSILIAGMGGRLLLQILKERREVVLAAKELILQPQSEIHLVRRAMMEFGFLITGENMLKEDGKYYVMMRAEISSEVFEKANYRLAKQEHFYFGRLLLERKDPVLLEFLMMEKSQYEQIYQELIVLPTKQTLQRQKEILERIHLIELAAGYYNK